MIPFWHFGLFRHKSQKKLTESLYFRTTIFQFLYNIKRIHWHRNHSEKKTTKADRTVVTTASDCFINTRTHTHAHTRTLVLKIQRVCVWYTCITYFIYLKNVANGRVWNSSKVMTRYNYNNTNRNTLIIPRTGRKKKWPPTCHCIVVQFVMCI